MFQVSEKGIAFIKANEGFIGSVGNDVGHPVIGYGHDLQPGESFPDGISPDQADLLLRKDLASRFEPAVNALIPPDCTQNQFDALIDFAYNLGIAALQTMTGHGWDEIPEQIPYWNHVAGKVNLGLIARRAKEVALFNS